MQPDAFADAVVVMVKNAMAPLYERLAASEARVVAAESRLAAIDALRDRLVTVETKAAQPVSAPAIELPAPVDLSPVLERISATEARLNTLGDLRDRVVVIETKAAQPVLTPTPDLPAPVDVSPILERVAASEARLNTIGDLRDRVVTLETKLAQPTPPVDLTDVRERLSAMGSELTALKSSESYDAAPLLEKFDGLTSEVNALRERIAVAETRQMIPGPMGRDGHPGRDGKDGRDGLDGMGWDDLAVKHDGERTFSFQSFKGDRVKDHGSFVVPSELYRGVYLEGKSYERGDCVTWGGSEWHCNETTNTKPGDGSKAWTLKVKRGRDGKDGRDAVTVPVVSVKR